MPQKANRAVNPDYRQRAERFMKRLELLQKEEMIELQPMLQRSQSKLEAVQTLVDTKPIVPPAPNPEKKISEDKK